MQCAGHDFSKFQKLKTSGQEAWHDSDGVSRAGLELELVVDSVAPAVVAVTDGMEVVEVCIYAASKNCTFLL